MGNIRTILDGVLTCGFVDRVIVSNNNPDVDLSGYIPQRDPRLQLIQQEQHTGPSYRYDLARLYDSEYYIFIDDDVFPNPWQLRLVFEALLRTPAQPHGSEGELFETEPAGVVTVKSKSLLPGVMTGPVDVILHTYFFTKAHLERYFELLEAMGVPNAEVHSSEDVIISFAGTERPIFVDVGYMPYCPTWKEWIRLKSKSKFVGPRARLMMTSR